MVSRLLPLNHSQLKKKRFNGGLEIYYAKKCHFWSFWAIVRCFGPLDRIKKVFFFNIRLIFHQPVRNTLYISILEELDNIDSYPVEGRSKPLVFALNNPWAQNSNPIKC